MVSRVVILLVALGAAAQASPRSRARPASTPSMPAAAPAPARSESAPAPARPPLAPAAKAGPGEGLVTYVSARRAYLSRGRSDGLAAGGEVALLRSRHPSATCRLELVAEHHATCLGEGVEAGDVFRVETPPPLPPAEQPKAGPRQPQVTAHEAERGRAALAAAPYELVPFHEADGEGSSARRVEASLGHTTWAVPGSATYHQERLDVALRGYEVGGGFRLSAAATALAWTGRPAGARFLPGQPMQLFVRELELSSREPGRAYAVSAGRLWPWYLPGLAVLDGAQVAWRSRGGLEVGAFAGALPDPVSLAPGLSRWAAGAYWAGRHVAEDGILRLLRHEGRIGMLSTPDGGQRLEAQVLVQGSFARLLDASADLRASLSSGHAALDAGRLDVSLHPNDVVRVLAGYRYLGDSLAALEGGFLGSAGSRHATVAAAWDVSPGLTVGLAGGLAEDLHATSSRRFVGPELSLPHLLGARGGVSFGYLEEFGWTAGRSGYVQSLLQVAERWQLLARLSYSDDAGPPAGRMRDATVYASANGRLWNWLSLRVSLLARVGVSAALAGAVDPGYTVSAALRGGY